MSGAFTRYPEAVAGALRLRGESLQPMPLAGPQAAPPGAAAMLGGETGARMFVGAPAPEAALSGLWLYFSELDHAHRICQRIDTAEGSFWHAILHRREPDPANSAYWFRRTGRHEVYPALLEEARGIAARYPGEEARLGEEWDPFAFIEMCEQARRRPGSPAEALAMEIQLAEWRLLFDYCVLPEGSR